MPATVWCRNEQKKEIKEYLLKEIGKLMEMIRSEREDVSINETEYGLDVEFPHGEIYGWAADYVEIVPDIFEELKKKYKDIAINGIIYEYETKCYETYGYYFRCDESDDSLTIVSDWQECANCAAIVEGEAFYNSSQFDYEEGSTNCLCSPTCMLEYCLSEPFEEVEMNDSFTEEETDEADEFDDPYEAIPVILWKRIVNNMDDYLEDFKKNKDRILTLADKDIDEDKKEFVLKIIERIEEN